MCACVCVDIHPFLSFHLLLTFYVLTPCHLSLSYPPSSSLPSSLCPFMSFPVLTSMSLFVFPCPSSRQFSAQIKRGSDPPIDALQHCLSLHSIHCCGGERRWRNFRETNSNGRRNSGGRQVCVDSNSPFSPALPFPFLISVPLSSSLPLSSPSSPLIHPLSFTLFLSSSALSHPLSHLYLILFLAQSGRGSAAVSRWCGADCRDSA